MNAAWGHASGVGIVLMMVVFVGIWVWAWRPRHKPGFDALARLPMHDADPHDDEVRR